MSYGLRDAIKALGGESKLAQAMLEAMGEGVDLTPVQNEIISEATPQGGFIALGTVKKCMDEERAGRILVQSPAFPKGPQPCDYVSPIGGAGYGFFAVPGIGATVLIGKTPFADPPNQNFWFGCLYAPGQRQLPDTKSQPYVYGEPTQLTKSEIKDNGEAPQEDPIVSYGIPNEEDVYRDNNLPDSYVLKHPAGHTLSMTDKNTSERTINEIKLKTAGNKRLIMSDAPPASVGEHILLIDENKNQIRITSIGEGDVGDDSIITHATGNIETYTKQGKQEHIISKESDGNFEITNAGKGDVEITSDQGHVLIEAKTNITLKCGESVIKITPDSVTIDASQVNVTGGIGDVNIQGISHIGHVHGDPDIFNGVTTPPAG